MLKHPDRQDRAQRAMSADDQADSDWVARLADEVIEAGDRRFPGRQIVCASGISPSGPIHLGNLREVMVPHLVADEIRRRGRDCVHIISWDDYDRFRKVPGGIAGIEAWNEHIGKPLTAVPPPPGSAHPNWAEHFKAALIGPLAVLGVEFRGIGQTEMYTSGAYRDQVLLAMRERDTIDAVLARYRTKKSDATDSDATDSDATDSAAAAGATDASATDDPTEATLTAEEAEQAAGSGAASEDDGTQTGGAYYPFKPYCHGCGTDFTTVTSYDPETTELDYTCRCGHSQTMHLDRDFHGKLVWKVDWPMRWRYEGVVFEPSGVDHQSPGSSYVVGGRLVEEVFGGEQPIGPMYAFVGISGMAKMSSSKGGVPTPADALTIMEPHILRWLYVRRRPNQSFTVAFDNEIHRLYDEWDALASRIAAGTEQPREGAVHSRSIRTAVRELPHTPIPVNYRALCSILDITGGNEDQMLRIVSAMDPEVASLDDVRPRLEKAATWVRTQAAPEDRTIVRTEPDTGLLASLDDVQRRSLALLAEKLETDWTLAGLTTLAYGVPKMLAGVDVSEKKLPPEVKVAQRQLFALLYRLLVGSETGPRIPTLLLCVGPDQVRKLIGQSG